jgi:hypothetical protein
VYYHNPAIQLLLHNFPTKSLTRAGKQLPLKLKATAFNVASKLSMLVCTSAPAGLFYFVDNCPDSVSERASESKNRRFFVAPTQKQRSESKNLVVL